MAEIRRCRHCGAYWEVGAFSDPVVISRGKALREFPASVSSVFGRRLTICSTWDEVRAALKVIDRYARLRLGYLEAYEDAHNLTNDDMFDAFNVPFLERMMSEGKPITFSHTPEDFPFDALGDERQFLRDHGYVFDPTTMHAYLP